MKKSKGRRPGGTMPVKSKGNGFMAPTNGTPGCVDMESNNPSVLVTSEMGGLSTIKECRLSIATSHE